MDDLDILQEMIKTPFLEMQSGKIELVENDNTDYTVTIKGAPDNCVVIKVDDFGVLKTESKGMELEDKQILKCYDDIGKEIRRKADYIIVCDDDGQKRIFYIELKKGKKDVGQEIINQLKGAKCFMEYFRAIGREFWEQKGKGKRKGKSNFLNFKDYDVRYIGFTDITLKTGRIRKNNKKKGKCPDDFFEFRNQSEINFTRLKKLPN